MSNRKVSVINPLPQGPRATSSDRAERYVKTGRAVWATPQNTAIRFTESNPGHRVAAESARWTALGYDAVGTMTRNQISGIPVLFPWRLR